MRRWVIALAATAALSVSAAAGAELTGDDAAALKDEVQTISMVSDCQWLGENADPTTFGAQSWALDEENTLFAVTCTRGAYQGSSLMFLRGPYGFKVLAFAAFEKDLGWYAQHEIVLDSFDETALELRTFAKARGIGDCGAAGRFQWTGYDFRLLEYRYKDCADEVDENDPLDWPMIYQWK